MTDRRFPGLFSTGVPGLLVALALLFAAVQPARAQALTTNFGSDLGAFSIGEIDFQLGACAHARLAATGQSRRTVFEDAYGGGWDGTVLDQSVWRVRPAGRPDVLERGRLQHTIERR